MSTTPELPYPSVHLDAGYLRRLETLALQIASIRERREGQGRSFLTGGGEEFVGYRPYRQGEDLRNLDWFLMARLDRPYVRVTRREATEHWSVLIDTSGSMGVGPPGKLQRAAETAGAFAAIGLHAGAQVELLTLGGEPERVRRFLVRRKGDLGRLVKFLEGLQARGENDLRSLLARGTAESSGGRVILIGDLLDLGPQDVQAFLGSRRALLMVQMLAPHELSPPRVGSVEWWDAEGSERASRHLEGEVRVIYEERLEEALESWQSFSLRHGASYWMASSEHSFEQVVRGAMEA